MAENSPADLADITFERALPEQLAGSFEEIQELRFLYYCATLGEHRSDGEIRHYVGHLSVDSWVQPDNQPFQTRWDPSVVVARNGRGRILGFSYAAKNVSSRVERYFREHGVPAQITEPIGQFERGVKRRDDRHRYIWGREYAHRPGYDRLVPILAGLNLRGYGRLWRGTFYPLAEESAKISHLETWGYTKDTSYAKELSIEEGFGPGSDIAVVNRWSKRRIDFGINKMIHEAGDTRFDHAKRQLVDRTGRPLTSR